jgi:hypothetical protein
MVTSIEPFLVRGDKKQEPKRLDGATAKVSDMGA